MDRQLLGRATDGSDAPTPGYIYVDLAKAAGANPSACQEMAQYLTRKLQSKNNPNIKFKCCKVIAKLCDQVPRNQFRRCLAQDPAAVAAVKDAMTFRGPLDPVQGDERNVRVRTAAREALDAVYREAPTSEVGGQGHMSASYAPSPHGGGGHGAYSGGGGQAGMGGGGGSRRMEGIGNPRYTDPRLDPRYNGTTSNKVKEVVQEAGQVVIGMIKDPLARNVGAHGVPDVPRQGYSGNLPGYGGGGGGSSSYGRPPGSAELARQTGGQWTMASNRGEGAVQPPPNFHQDQEYYKARDTSYQWAQKSSTGGGSAGGVGGSWANANTGSSAGTVVASSQQYQATPSVTINHNPSAPGTGGGVAASDGTYEKNLIQELCPPGGMKAVPPPDKLASFARAVPSLNPDLVCPVLLDCLEDGQPWVIRAKALCVMETCIQNGFRNGPNGEANPYRDFFHACQEEVAPLSNHPRAAIRDPASRVLQLLGVAAPPAPAAVPSPRAAPAPAAPAPNLLDFDNDVSATPAAPAPSSAPPPPPRSEAPPPAPAASQPSASNSMFGGMQIKAGAPGVVAAPSATAVEKPPTSGNLLDFQAPAAAEPVVANGDAGPSSMFAQMNLKVEAASDDRKNGGDDNPASDTTDLKVLSPNSGASGPSSAFGFINSDSNAAASSAEAHPPAPQSFDPLKNASPTNTQARKMMQMSPEQMQAIAYQQMMMQKQMQHMQMAMAMQRGAVVGGMSMPPMYPNLGAPGGGAGVPPSSKMVMHHSQGSAAGGGVVNSGFSFMDAPRPAKKDDKKFDFVKDAMQHESHK